MRQALARLRGDALFRWRSPEPTRVEAFSDAAFAFALTLLVVSLEVPSTSQELLQAMRGIPAFAASFAVLTWIWYQHYLFFQRYGVTDLFVVILNAVLVFLVLIYVYPLKFLFSAVAGVTQITGSLADARALHLLYSGGFFLVFAVLLVLHLHVWRLRDQLELDVVERSITRYEIRHSWITMAVAALSVGLSYVPGIDLRLPGMAYFLLGPAHGLHGFFSGRSWSRLAAERGETSNAPDASEEPART